MYLLLVSNDLWLFLASLLLLASLIMKPFLLLQVLLLLLVSLLKLFTSVAYESTLLCRWRLGGPTFSRVHTVACATS
jgi:hypothetical protein